MICRAPATNENTCDDEACVARAALYRERADEFAQWKKVARTRVKWADDERPAEPSVRTSRRKTTAGAKRVAQPAPSEQEGDDADVPAFWVLLDD